MRRRLIVPEVVQTSMVDCGPASLKCLLEGFGVHASYGRLREACQTDVDGTSIDTLEDVASQLGLVVEQVMVPADHVLIPEARTLPAIVITRLPNGSTHFVVLWRSHGRFVQVMDPASGRSFQTRAQLSRSLYLHTLLVPATEWREWAASDSFLRPLGQRLARLGVPGAGGALITAALEEPGWQSLATLDAATRMVESLVQSGGLRRGRQASRALELFWRQSVPEALTIPEVFWSVRPAPPATEGANSPGLLVTGAVLLSVKGLSTDLQPGAPASPLSPEIAATLEEPPARPGRELLRLLRADGLLSPAILGAAIGAATGGVLLEALLFRGLFDIGRTLGPLEQRLGMLGLLLLALVALLLLDVPIASGVQRLGRHLEARLRIAFLEKLPRLADRYFHSRPTSDMAERSHSLHAVRALPALGAQLLRSVLALVMTTAGIAWLAPTSAPLALGIAALSVVLPLLAQRGLSEQDLRMRTHSGALGRFYLDALLGLIAVRAHGAERSVRRQHERLLVEWSRAGRSFQRWAVVVEGLQAVMGFGLSGWIFLDSLTRQGSASGSLLLLYWALNLPALGQEIGLLVRQYPSHRNITLRLLEPLGALEDRAPAPSALPPRPASKRAVSIQMEGVGVRAAGHTVLEGIHLSIEPGSHVAIVGPSGAGKSSLVGLLLGWHRPASGRLLIDGHPIEGQLQALRQRTAWVDPAVQLWNRSLLENLTYGASETPRLGPTLAGADLHDVLGRLPEGLQTLLGEGGALLSGGEGQRVRLGRALLKPHPGLVILDEPFRGLDRERRRALLARTREWWRESTLLCITHDVGETREFDRVLVVEAGRVIEDGAPQALASRPGTRYRALLEAEEAVRRELWSSAEWRRLQLEAGQLVEARGSAP
jgi:ABC-type bacteriocin/lantibiotic exporter with double-glycine peptidase domain